MLCNVDWLDACSNVVGNTLPKMKPDHYPILLTCVFYDVRFMSQFKFMKMCSNNHACIDVIKQSWMTKVYGCPMYILNKKLRIIKANLKILNKTLFGNVRTKVLEAEKNLIDI